MLVDLYDPETQEDWYPTYRHLRDSEPVYQIPGSSIYVLTRYEDVLYVLRHQDLFPTGTSLRRSDIAQKVYESGGWKRMTPLSTNPPEHRRYRELVDHFFNGPGLDRRRQEIDDVIDNLIVGFEGDGAVEYVSRFAMPLPVRMITRILGFPEEDIERLKAWSEAWVLPFAGGLTPEQEVWVAEQVVEFYDYIAELIAEKREEPADDVMSSLIEARFGGERPLADQEIITILDHLFIGGNETTTFALTAALWILLREDNLYEQVLNDRALVPVFIEEALRLESPTQGLYRNVARDVTIHGVEIPAGSTVHIRYAAANRDERTFQKPDSVDLDRANGRRHMAFSLGEHSCPGSGLSRLEQQMALNAVLDRLPNLRLTEGRNDFRHHPGLVLRALSELHLSWG
ncbi:MAG: cytochrome P450 [Actinomycetota bacterium]|nr:cytochrome P450 [Actinomycetota bacterium]